MKLHNYHWYVKGNQFFTLHVKFQELYEESTLHLDDLAERLLALEGKPVATMKEHLEFSSVKEATGKETSEEMVNTLISDFSNVAGRASKKAWIKRRKKATKRLAICCLPSTNRLRNTFGCSKLLTAVKYNSGSSIEVIPGRLTTWDGLYLFHSAALAM